MHSESSQSRSETSFRQPLLGILTIPEYPAISRFRACHVHEYLCHRLVELASDRSRSRIDPESVIMPSRRALSIVQECAILDAVVQVSGYIDVPRADLFSIAESCPIQR
jgi:hypothetical protein